MIFHEQFPVYETKVCLMFFLKSFKSFLVFKRCLYQHFEAFYELIVLWIVLQTAAQIVKGLPMANSATGQ